MSLLGRFFGPSLGVRLGADGLNPRAGARSELVEFRLVAAPLFTGAGALALASVLVNTQSGPMPGYRPALLTLVALGGLVLGLTLALWDFVTRPWMIHLCGAFACVACTLGTVWSGPWFAPFGSMFFVLTAVALVMFLDRRGSFALVVLIGLCEGWALWVLDPTPAPVGRWILLVGVCAVGAATVDALVGRLAASTRAESAARRAAEAARVEAERARRLMEAASQHKSEFLAGMSHELRTPLNAVIGFADVLKDQHFGPLNERQADYVEDIRAAGAHLLTLINDVLDLAKVEAGRMELHPTWFSLEEAIAAAVSLVRERAQAGRLLVSVQVDVEAKEAYGDNQRINQVLVNLLTNAVKYTPAGGCVDVVGRRVDDATVVEVHDTGIGIAEADQARVFEDFHQVGEPQRAQEGTGLGLALTRRLLELHGGEVWVRSAPGVGSTFGFRLPLPARSPATGVPSRTAVS